MALRSTIVAGCVVTAIAVGGSQWALARHDARTEQVRSTPVSAQPTPADVTTSGGNLSATIPRTVVIRLDTHGRPVSAMTNTGAPPVGDEQIHAVQHGIQVPVPKALVHRIRTHRYSGDWSRAGDWHAW
ncbi:hypothetical protein [Nocardioides sp. WS12]|uniref:hypothetical protein n=1 Tax=Nocardioides sp. WS12 TaxID=2486272 RepID=UPI0015FB73ED|nr:hypothetical protein [Nocardioides sp. WS12]